MSGVAAAAELARARPDARITLIEARDRAGGRMHQTLMEPNLISLEQRAALGNPRCVVQLGANWIHGMYAEKNPLFMQIYADVLGYPMLLAGSTQTPALGSAIAAAVTAGATAGGYDTYEAAQAQMTKVADTRYLPDPAAQKTYDTLYGLYRELHDTFGGMSGARADLPTLMKRLLALRERAQGDHTA